MSAVWTRRLVDMLIVLVALAALGAILKAGGAIAEGKFHMVSYPASSENIRMEYLDEEGTAFWQLKEGTIRIDDHAWLRALRLALQFTFLGLFAASLVYLRGLLSRIGAGEVFTDRNVTSLKRIGQILLFGAALSVVATIIVQSVIINALPAIEGRAIHPSISWDKDGVENIWLEYSPPISSLLLSLLAFLAAGAFRSGQQFREDSESVV
ncbi:hypothetical protein NAP1_04035 [Erythrobacter sp. NAP1]|uniref:DUF2975 domain-containing protein n=1 Tax=Erythrobacter sp. NAP1 TaxID=237727 RepID=UPI0000686EAB|nr:DUF2975 domain-containing protein [Erythrobacter sp. NAP1]EAQ29913.1 hypothetical protein NAP1_04035 [Erythrobacter sp. NAP1]